MSIIENFCANFVKCTYKFLKVGKIHVFLFQELYRRENKGRIMNDFVERRKKVGEKTAIKNAKV